MQTGYHAESPMSSEGPAEQMGLSLVNPPFASSADPIAQPYLPAQAANTREQAESEGRQTETGGTPPGWPPSSGDGTGFGRGGRRGRTWRYGLAALALTVMLAGGVGIGRAITVGHSSTTLGASSAPAIAVSSNVTSLQQTVENVARAVEPSVVEITSTGGGGQEAIGSGDILTSDGYIVTNDHVVQGFTSFTVTLSDGQNLRAELIGQDPQDDLAVLKISATNLQPIAFADSSQVTVGEFAIAVGNPYGLRETATFGTVTATNRTASESPDGPAGVLTGLIQTSAPIAPGNSGGALVDLQGRLIGIPTLGESGQQGGSGSTTVGLAIPANEVKTVAQQLIQNGHVSSTGQGFLGIQGRDVTPALAAADGLSVQSGVLVGGFANDAAGQSPAEQAGLQTNDVIIAVNGQAITGSSDLASAVLGLQPGTKVTLTIVRGSSQHTVQVTLGERPAGS